MLGTGNRACTSGVATEGKFYCRRHAGVLRAVGAEVTPQGGLPDIDNRAPSLVSWIARDLDEQSFTAAVRARVAASASPQTAAAYEQAMPPAQSFHGLQRYLAAGQRVPAAPAPSHGRA